MFEDIAGATSDLFTSVGDMFNSMQQAGVDIQNAANILIPKSAVSSTASPTMLQATPGQTVVNPVSPNPAALDPNGNASGIMKTGLMIAAIIGIGYGAWYLLRRA